MRKVSPLRHWSSERVLLIWVLAPLSVEVELDVIARNISCVDNASNY
jgi:hypothetical protein